VVPINLEWRVGSDGAEVPLGEIGAPTVVPSNGRRLPILMALGVLYSGAIVAAAWFGFQLGRWTDDRASGLADVDTQLAIEALAWRDGDLSLYFSTLDPGAAPRWREEAARRFSAAAPDQRSMKVIETLTRGPDLVEVAVEVGSDAGSSVERRSYRLVGRSWFQTEPAGESPTQ